MKFLQIQKSKEIQYDVVSEKCFLEIKAKPV